MVALPWVRVSHLEPTKSRDASDRRNDVSGEVRYFDVVHEHFLPRYLEVLARDAEAAALRMHQHSEELVTGLGISSLEETHDSLQPLPESYKKFLGNPCTIVLGRNIPTLGIQIRKNEGEISSPEFPDVIGWIDGYDWLDREVE
ncbi:hypothetical protein GCM10023079_05520 [Streptomyces chitinivorans]